MANPIVHWEITSTDATRAQDFYSKLFDWNVDANNPYKYGIVSAPDGRGIGGGIGPEMGGGNRVSIYIEVDDLQAYLDKAESLGGKTLMPPGDVPGGPTLAMFSDPDGNCIGLVKAGTMGAQ